jgi:hypothetical protein
LGGAGSGDYQGELAPACEAIIGYAGWLCMPLSHILIRLDGLYGTTAVLIPLLLSGMGVIVRSKEYGTIVIGATKAEVGFDTSVSVRGVQHLLDVATRLVPDLAQWPSNVPGLVCVRKRQIRALFWAGYRVGRMSRWPRVMAVLGLP